MKNSPLVLLAAILLLATSAAAQNKFPYQGRLEKNGAALNGLYDFQFRLFKAASGGSETWAETQTGIKVSGGSFSVNLGSAASIPDAALNGPDIYLQIAVKRGSEPSYVPLLGRQQILDVPRARGYWEPIHNSNGAAINSFTALSIPVSLASHTTFKLFITGRLVNSMTNAAPRLYLTLNDPNQGTIRQTGTSGYGVGLFNRPNPTNPTDGEFTCEYTISSRSGSDRKFLNGSCQFDDGVTLTNYENIATESGDGELNTLHLRTAGNVATESVNARVSVWGVKQ